VDTSYLTFLSDNLVLFSLRYFLIVGIESEAYDLGMVANSAAKCEADKMYPTDLKCDDGGLLGNTQMIMA
jgi:hypothetical protein